MNENSRYAVGVDVGTSYIRCVVASLDNEAKPRIVGCSQVENSGMKKGVISHLAGPNKALDKALNEAENMSGQDIKRACFSINGCHILSTKTDGMIAINSPKQVVSLDDLDRVEEVASIGKIPNNREILKFIPYSYSLDGQDGIADPMGMNGNRLEVYANIISSLAPHINNIHILAEEMEMNVTSIIPSVMAASEAVLNEKQKESGVVVIDMGATTTGVAIYEEGDIQFLRVVPMGGQNITNDLAICLKITPDIAEEIKLKHALAIERSEHHDIVVKRGREHYSFNTSEIDEIIEARLEEIFEEVRKVLKVAGKDAKLPSGAVLVGGGSNMKKIDEFAKKHLDLATQIGKSNIESSVSEEVFSPEFAVAVGLMLEDTNSDGDLGGHHQREKEQNGFFARLFRRNK